MLSGLGSTERVSASHEEVRLLLVLELVELKDGVHFVAEHAEVVEMRLRECVLRLVLGAHQDFAEGQRAGQNGFVEGL